MKEMYLHPEQQYKLEELWLVYGNHGKKFTMANHRFIQTILEQGKDSRDFFKPTQECINAVDRIIKDPNNAVDDNQPKASHGGARFHPPGRKYGRPPKEVKVKHIRSAIAEPESPEEVQAIEWWKGLSPKERLRLITQVAP